MDSIWILDYSNATINKTFLNVLDNRPTCSNQDLIYQKFQEPYVIFSVISLVLLNIAIIGGNILVITAIFVSSKLKTVTNHFIMSLAVSDLLLGLAIIPYSLCLAVLDIWIFGEIWCLGWLVIDVWLSTASIMNLCAISVDRYLAVTRPVRYRTIMTSHRAKLIILFVWILSFIVSFPPLMGWNDKAPLLIKAENREPKIYRFLKENNLFNNNASNFCYAAQTQCVLFDDVGYVTYSALGSFFIPMSFMIFFYWRIYIVASRTTRAFKRGYKKTKNKTKNQRDQDDESLTLRIHRGYICAETNLQGSSEKNLVSPSISEENPSEDSTTFPKSSIHPFGSTKYSNEYSSTYLKVPNEKKSQQKKSITVYRSPRLTAQLMVSNKFEKDSKSDKLKGPQKVISKTHSSVGRFSRRTHTGKWQAKRLIAETKAAKTVGIIVGGFIFCWFPFFTAYLVRGYCSNQSCIPHLMLTIFTWLGYANSAINPVIYGLFSPDFRRAFKRIICLCKFKDEVGVTSLIRQIHLPNLFEEDNTCAKNESKE